MGAVLPAANSPIEENPVPGPKRQLAASALGVTVGVAGVGVGAIVGVSAGAKGGIVGTTGGVLVTLPSGAGVAGTQDARANPAMTVTQSKRIDNSFFDIVSSLRLKIMGFYTI